MNSTSKHTTTSSLDTIEDAITDIKAGKVIIVVDDENRENEGDFIAAADSITPEIVNFMAQHGRGLICVPLTEKRCQDLQLKPMVETNTDPMETAFTVSVDLNGNGVTTGLSVSDRAKTIKALVNPSIKPHELARPGHIFPLVAKEGGVLRRTGHTEAAIDFARLAGYQPAGVIVEIMNEDGSMARLPELFEVAKRFDLKIVSIEDLVAYRMQHDSLIEKKNQFEIDTRFGKFELHAYQQTTNSQVHIALTKGSWKSTETVMTRINSSRINNDLLGILTQENNQHLDRIFSKLNTVEKGAIVFVNQYQKSENILHRLSELQDMQQNTDFKLPPVTMDKKDFGIGAQILHDLNIHKLDLLTNSTQIKRVGMAGYGLEIVKYVEY